MVRLEKSSLFICLSNDSCRTLALFVEYINKAIYYKLSGGKTMDKRTIEIIRKIVYILELKQLNKDISM